MKKILPFFILCSVLASSFAQKVNTFEIRGKVLDVSYNKHIGVSSVKVFVKNDYDITDKDGNFKLLVEKGTEKINISIENTNKKMLSPYEGWVNLPPSGNINIHVCAEENQRLIRKVNELNQSIKKLQIKNSFSSQQVIALQKEMLDTILFFEHKIANLEKKIETQNTDKEKLMKEIVNLSDSIISLSKALLIAKEEQFLRQQEVFKRINSDLKNYLDALENLNLMLDEHRVSAYFNGGKAYTEFNDKLDAYNAARKVILEHHDNEVKAVSHYWENIDLAEQCDKTYQYALREVHERIVFPMNNTVIDYFKQFSAMETSRNKAINGVKNGVNSAKPQLLPAIEILRTKIEDLVAKLKV